MKPGKQRLILDLFDEGLKAQTLQAGKRVLRRRRYVRAATRGMGLALLVGLAALWLAPKSTRQAAAPASASIAKAATIHSLTDEELLALFPNTPVGLATLANGNKKLLFPRAGDEERFIHRL